MHHIHRLAPSDLALVRDLNTLFGDAFDDPETPRLILQHYPYLRPEDRPEAINTLVSRPAYARALLRLAECIYVD